MEREGYALAAGLALGLVVAGAAHTLGPDTQHIARRLRTYMLGGDKLPLTGRLYLFLVIFHSTFSQYNNM